MAIGESTEDSRPYLTGLKPGPLLQVPRPTGFFSNHLPLAPADGKQDSYLDARYDTRHDQYQPNIPRAIDNISPAFNGMAFGDNQNSLRPPIGRRMSQQSVTLSIHGLEDPMSADLVWQPSNAIGLEQRSRLERHIRKILSDITGGDNGKFGTPIRPRTTSTEGSRRASWTPDYRAAGSYQFVQGHKRYADGQMSRTGSPEDADDSDNQFDIISMQQIRLGDEEAIRQYYDLILRGIQQLALKQVLKEWIKEIEPKKQKNCPYKKGIRPKWWPDAAAYKEPDHIKVDDRIHLAIGIIRHAQDPNELNGEGIDKLHKVVNRQELLFDTDPPEKQTFRKQLLENLFALARAEQSVKNDERDATELISLPTVKKFERPNKRRKKTAAEKKDSLRAGDVDGSGSMMLPGQDDGKTSNGLLKVETLRSSATTPNTPTWTRHATQDSGVCFPHPNDHASQGQSQHMLSYGQHYDASAPVDGRYSSFDESTIDGSNSSPMSQYPSSATSTSSIHMNYPSSSQACSVGYQAPMHGVPMQSHGSEIYSDMILPSQGRPSISVCTAVTEPEDRGWSTTPASYLPPQQPTFTTPNFYA